MTPSAPATPAPAPAAPPLKSQRVARIQRTALALLLVSGVINYADRSTLAIGMPLIRKDLGLDEAQSGLLLSSFLFAYALSQLPAGALIDRWGGRIMLSLGLAVWSLAQGLGGLVANFRQFIAARAVLGIGESPQFPTCARVVTDWFPRRERGTATGIWNTSSTLGTAISAPLLTFLMLKWGWRWMFGVMAVVGLVVAVAAYLFHRNPSEVDLTPEELRYLSEEKAGRRKIAWAQWRKLFTFPTTWGMALGFFGSVYTNWLYSTWLPQYLEIQWHFSIRKTGWIASLPFLCGVAGAFLGGRVCDGLLRRGFSPIHSRQLPQLTCLYTAGLLTVVTAFAPNSGVAVACICITVFLLMACSSSAWALATVATENAYTASLGSIQNCGGYLGGALAPTVTGYILKSTHTFRPALLVGASVACICATLHLLLVRKPVLPDGEPD